MFFFPGLCSLVSVAERGGMSPRSHVPPEQLLGELLAAGGKVGAGVQSLHSR